MLLNLTAFFCPYLFKHVHAVRIIYIPPRVGRIDSSGNHRLNFMTNICNVEACLPRSDVNMAAVRVKRF